MVKWWSRNLIPDSLTPELAVLTFFHIISGKWSLLIKRRHRDKAGVGLG